MVLRNEFSFSLKSSLLINQWFQIWKKIFMPSSIWFNYVGPISENSLKATLLACLTGRFVWFLINCFVVRKAEFTIVTAG